MDYTYKFLKDSLGGGERNIKGVKIELSRCGVCVLEDTASNEKGIH